MFLGQPPQHWQALGLWTLGGLVCGLVLAGLTHLLLGRRGPAGKQLGQSAWAPLLALGLLAGLHVGSFAIAHPTELVGRQLVIHWELTTRLHSSLRGATHALAVLVLVLWALRWALAAGVAANADADADADEVNAGAWAELLADPAARGAAALPLLAAVFLACFSVATGLGLVALGLLAVAVVLAERQRG